MSPSPSAPSAAVMTEQECLTLGGHCWVQDPFTFVYAVDWSPMLFTRQCKHCGKRQEGDSQPRIKWDDAQ